MATNVPTQPQRWPPVRQRVGQQGDDKPHERREDQAHEECQPEADAPAAADDAHQDGQQAAAQQAEQYDQNTHGSKFLTCKTVVRTERPVACPPGR